MYQEAARPVLFESPCEDYSYWGLGSSVLVWNAGTYFWITARHVMEKQGQSFDTLRIFPDDVSRLSLPFNALHKIITSNPEEDFADLYMLQIDVDEFKRSGDAPLTAQDLEIGCYSPGQLKVGDELLVVGYPEESRSVDYEQFKIKFQRKVFTAGYIGPSEDRYCHHLMMKDNLGLSTYNGLSGSPVFYLARQDALAFPKLVGLLIRGTAESKLGHFVGSDVLAHATTLASRQ